jgi:hypothetical protein
VKSRFFENAVEQNQWFAKSARSKSGVLTQSGALFGTVAVKRDHSAMQVADQKPSLR